MRIEPVQAKCGCITARVNNGEKDFFLHSAYDPVKEAAKFIANYNLSIGSTVVVYGVGLGYHIREILVSIGPAGKLILFQLGTDIFQRITAITELTDVLHDPRVTTIIRDDIGKLAGELALYLGELINFQGQLIIHRPSLELLPVTAVEIKQALEEWETVRSTQQRFSPLLIENLKLNMDYCQELPRVEALFGSFKAIPVVLVAGGPSVDIDLENLHLFRERTQGLIISVGTSLKALSARGIIPHLAIITDPQLIVQEQVQGLTLNTPLIILPTIHPVVIETYPGPKILACQQGMDGMNKLCSDKSILVKTGGSVATTLLDIAIRMGANPLIFAGLDLAYPGGKAHASNTMYQHIEGNLSMTNKYLHPVRNNRGEEVGTTRIFNIYRKWIEERIARENGLTFYNTSLDGAAIKGTRVMPLAGLIKTLPSLSEDLAAKLQKLIS
jgi:hypothetical protein